MSKAASGNPEVQRPGQRSGTDGVVGTVAAMGVADAGAASSIADATDAPSLGEAVGRGASIEDGVCASRGLRLIILQQPTL